MAAPEPDSVFDTPLDDMEETRLDALAEAEIAAGKGVPHERVRAWLAEHAKGKKLPPPTA